ncbi:MAG: NAD+ synthase [Actinomycetales bacterium]|nr:NAD+ synthase [Actinomycetales bacterium]
MPNLRISLAQANATVGDLAGNAERIRSRARSLCDGQGPQLIAFPEMMLTGYPVEDLALRASFQDASIAGLSALARDLEQDGCGQAWIVVGYLDRIESQRWGTRPVNAAGVLHGGQVVARYVKHHLPNYGVFDEARTFVPGDAPLVLEIAGTSVALAICEDLWQEGGPVAWARQARADLLVVINASPYERNKDDVRLELCQRRAREAGCALAYVNLVGGQDELVFDGDSLIVDAEGSLLARAPQFAEADLAIELGAPGPIAPRLSDLEEVYRALELGLADYVAKNGFRSVMLGLSGGIDSALVAALACDAIGAERVYGVSLPSAYSSDHSKDDAAELAGRTGLHYRTVSIEPMVESFLAQLSLTGLAEENLQARVRGTTLMALSNQEGHLILTTGNKSELSVGYSTLYGDSVGGFAPIKDVPKTLVWELARWRNAQAVAAGAVPPIPESSITKPPSAELRPGQVDTDSLPEYERLDAILAAYVDADRGAADLVRTGFDPALVNRILRLTDLAEYKRRQYPPGTKISLRAFGRDRRLPITNAWREQAPG